MASPAITNAFTVDVEDFYQVSAFEREIPRETWSDFESRVERSALRMLELLAAHDVHATFFILGWTAQQHPQLVQAIADAGHEVGSHSFWHRLVYSQTPDEFRADLRQSRDVLEQIVGRPVTTYRAPSFSITGKSLWAREILVEEGFTCDSSVFPVHHDRYGIPGAQRFCHRIETSAGHLWEFPPSVMRIRNWNLPVAGGGYFRLYPRWLTSAAVRHVNRQGQPFMFYVHPWEIDDRQPKLTAGTRLSRWRHRVNLRHTWHKLDELLHQFSWSTMSAALAATTEYLEREPQTRPVEQPV